MAALTLWTAAARRRSGGRQLAADGRGEPVAGATLRAYAAEDSRAFRARAMRGADRTPIATAQSAEGGVFRIDGSAPMLEISVEAAYVRSMSVAINAGMMTTVNVD